MIEEISPGIIALTAEGNPNVGAIVGPESIMCLDARATPAAAAPWLAALRAPRPKPVEHLALTHYHAVRTLGASAFGARHIVAHDATRRWIQERGREDWETELRRFPALFPEAAGVPGLTHPDTIVEDCLVLPVGDREVHLLWLGAGHTLGDLVVWVPDARVLFAGDLVENRAAPYAGDASIASWRTGTLDAVAALDALALVPGRGEVLRGDEVADGIEATREYLRLLHEAVGEAHDRGATLEQAATDARQALEPRFGSWFIFEHCLPFNVVRAYDEAKGLEPQTWTAERDERARALLPRKEANHG